jgi:hypothetical protein
MAMLTFGLSHRGARHAGDEQHVHARHEHLL